MAHTFTNLLIHATFSTSGRIPMVTDTIRPELHAYIGGILRNLRVEPLAIGGTSDHVHILLHLPADCSVADCLRVLKTNSSRWIKEKCPDRCLFSWQGGYGAFTVSESMRATVIRYIRDQAKHHQRISFQDEFRALLKNHSLEFDERYIWQ